MVDRKLTCHHRFPCWRAVYRSFFPVIQFSPSSAATLPLIFPELKSLPITIVTAARRGIRSCGSQDDVSEPTVFNVNRETRARFRKSAKTYDRAAKEETSQAGWEWFPRSQIDILPRRGALARFDSARDTFCFLTAPVAIFPRPRIVLAVRARSRTNLTPIRKFWLTSSLFGWKFAADNEAIRGRRNRQNNTCRRKYCSCAVAASRFLTMKFSEAECIIILELFDDKAISDSSLGWCNAQA